MPMFGVRSPQLIAAAGQAGPTSRVQRTAPVAASNPYARSFSVTATTVFPTTTGWA